MTHNQIEYQKHLEQKRTNFANEQLVGAKITNEHVDRMVQNAETKRHNLATEIELTRSHTANEGETKRHNQAVEQEQQRYNQLQQELNRMGLDINARSVDVAASNVGLGYAQLNQTRTRDQQNYEIGMGNLDVNNRNLSQRISEAQDQQWYRQETIAQGLQQLIQKDLMIKQEDKRIALQAIDTVLRGVNTLNSVANTVLKYSKGGLNYGQIAGQLSLFQ